MIEILNSALGLTLNLVSCIDLIFTVLSINEEITLILCLLKEQYDILNLHIY